MQKSTKKYTDFFTSYRNNQLHKTFVSGWIAVFAAFSIVSVMHGDVDMQGLMASVENITEAPRLEADIIMKRDNNSLSIIFGANAKSVDQVEFTLLSDPSKFKWITVSDSNITVIENKEMGTYHIKVLANKKNLTPGTLLTQLWVDIDSMTPIAIADTEFVSNGQRYALTSKSE